MRTEIVTPRGWRRLYHSGDEFSLEGLKVFAVYEDGTDADVTAECSFSPASGTVLWVNSPDAIEETQDLTVTYVEQNTVDFSTRVFTDTVSFTVRDIAESLEIVPDVTYPTHFPNEPIPVLGLRVNLRSRPGTGKSRSVTKDYLQYFDTTVLALGENHITASYQLFPDEPAATASIEVEAVEPVVDRVVALDDNVPPVRRGGSLDLSLLSVQWYRSDYGRAGRSAEETTGVVPWDAGGISASVGSIPDYGSREVSVCLTEHPDVVGTFQAKWTRSMVSAQVYFPDAISAMYSPLDRAALGDSVYVSEVGFDDGSSKTYSHPFECEYELTLDFDPAPVPMGYVSAATTISAIVNGECPEDTPTVATKEISAYRMPDSFTVVTMPTKLEYWDGESPDYTGLQVRLEYSNGDIEYFADDMPARPLDELSLPSGPLSWSEDLVNLNVQYTEKVSGLETTTTTTIPIVVVLDLMEDAKIVAPQSIRFGETLLDATLSVKYRHSVDDSFDLVVDRTSRDVITLSSDQQYSQPTDGTYEISGSIGLSVDWTRETGSELKTLDTIVAEVQVEFPPEGDNHLILTVPPVKTVYVEGEEFDPSGLEAELVVGDGWTTLNATRQVMDSLAGIVLHKGQTGLVGRFSISVAGVEQSFTVDIPVEVQDILVFSVLADHTAGVAMNPLVGERGVVVSEVTIPDTVFLDGEDRPVTRVLMDCFNGCSSLETVVVPETVLVVEDRAFMDCTSLRQISLPGVTEIGGAAFHNCTSLESVVLPARPGDDDTPNTPVSIGTAAFDNTPGLTIFDFSNVGSLGYEVFRGGGLASADVGAFISDCPSAFKECTSLTSLHVSGAQGGTVVPASLCEGCTGLDNVVLANVVSIEDNAFSGCTSLVDIDLEDGICDIGRSAFKGCSSLQTMTIHGGTVGPIHSAAFMFGTDLEGKHVIFQDLNRQSVEDLYNSSAWAEDTDPENVPNWMLWSGTGDTPEGFIMNSDDVVSRRFRFEMMEDVAGVRIVGVDEEYVGTELDIPRTTIIDGGTYDVVEIGPGALSGITTLRRVTFPEFLTTIREDAFDGCTSLEEVEPNFLVEPAMDDSGEGEEQGDDFWEEGDPDDAGDDVVSDWIEDLPEGEIAHETQAWQYDEVTLVPATVFNVTTVGDRAFARTAITEFKSGTVEYVGEQAFSFCSRLSAFDTSNVRHIGDLAFEDCTSLAEFDLTGVEELGEYVLNGCTSITDLSVSNRKTIVGLMTNPAFVSSIAVVPSEWHPDQLPEEMFKGCHSLVKLNIDSQLSDWGDYTFKDCSILREIETRPDFVVTSPNTFKDVRLAEDFKSSDGTVVYRFFPAHGQEKLTVGKSILSVMSYAFSQETGGSVRVIEFEDRPQGTPELLVKKFAFDDCQDVASVLIKCSSLGHESPSRMFRNLDSLTYLETNLSCGAYPSMLTGCDELSCIVFGPSVVEIGYDAFSVQGKLSSVTLPASVSAIRENAFFRCGLRSVVFEGNGSVVVEGDVFWQADPDLTAYITSAAVPYEFYDTDGNPVAFDQLFGKVQFLSVKGSLDRRRMSGCSDLVDVVALSCMGEVGNEEFRGLSALSSVSFVDGSPAVVGQGAFRDCPGLVTLELGDPFNWDSNARISMGPDCFRDSPGLTAIYISALPPTIASNTFATGGESLSIYCSKESRVYGWTKTYLSTWSSSLSDVENLPVDWSTGYARPTVVRLAFGVPEPPTPPPPPPPTSRDYSQDGLVVMFDGQDNADWETHDGSARRWVDLVTGTEFSVPNNTSFDDNSLTWSADVVLSLSPIDAIGGEDFYVGDKTLEFVGQFNCEVANTLGFRGQSRFGLYQRGRTVDGQIAYYDTDTDLYSGYKNRYWKTTYPEEGVFPPVMVAGSIVQSDGYVQCYLNGLPIFEPIQVSHEYVSGWDTIRWCGAAGCHLYCVRVYDRALTASEVAAHHAVDVARFNLED